MIRAGGYLTPFLRHRLVEEYVGHAAGTVCEDMEIIVRLHRFVLDKQLDRRIAFLPHPVAWTEVPETFESLRKQRGRWYRGLRESLRYHRRACWAGAKFGRIGWFALPAFWLFEYCGPLIEVAGYLWSCFSSWSRRWSGRRCIESALFPGLPAGLARLRHSGQCRCGAGRRMAVPLRPGRPAAAPAAALRRLAGGPILLGYAVLENFGYRQLTLYWRLRGLWDAWRGKTGWEKFARVGFRTGASQPMAEPSPYPDPAGRRRPDIARLVQHAIQARSGSGRYSVATGREALDALDGIDIVLLDQQLPDTNGLDVLDAIRARPIRRPWF